MGSAPIYTLIRDHNIVLPAASNTNRTSATASIGVWSRLSVVAGTLTAAVIVVLAAAGCSPYLSAGSLSPDLAARRVDNAQTVDLSRLAQPWESNELIGVGDVLDISIAGGLSVEATARFLVRVGDDGGALLPDIGPVHLARLEFEEAEGIIAQACVQRHLYRQQPHVTVSLERRRLNRVMVVGAVKKQGTYELPHGSSDLLAALVAAGGLDKDAGTIVEIRCPSASPTVLTSGQPPHSPRAGVQQASATTNASQENMTSMRIDLAQSIQKYKGGMRLTDGSVVNVEKRDPESIQVIGLVRKPDQYDFPMNRDLRLLDAIAMAGGMTYKVADKILVIRKRPDADEAAVIEISFKKAKHDRVENLRLQPGDTVSVEQTMMTAVMDALGFVRIGATAGLDLMSF